MWHSQTKGRATEKTNSDLQPSEVREDISVSEIPTEALPGVGVGYRTQERRQNKRWRNVGACHSRLGTFPVWVMELPNKRLLDQTELVIFVILIAVCKCLRPESQ